MNELMTSIQRGPQVSIHTTYGIILIELHADRTPLTVENFVEYVRDRFFDNTLFHRVIDNFIIQGGGFEPGMIQKTTRPPIENESAKGVRNERGTISMARVASDPNSATSQFFINTRDNDILDYGSDSSVVKGYCAFGRIIEGMEIVDRIEGVATTTVGDHQDVPIKDIAVERIELV